MFIAGMGSAIVTLQFVKRLGIHRNMILFKNGLAYIDELSGPLTSVVQNKPVQKFYNQPFLMKLFPHHRVDVG